MRYSLGGELASFREVFRERMRPPRVPFGFSRIVTPERGETDSKPFDRMAFHPNWVRFVTALFRIIALVE